MTHSPILSGTVIHGFGRGRQLLGYPTANLCLDTLSYEVSSQVSPGVYAGVASVNGGPWYPMSLSVGTNPTFGDVENKTFEAYLHNVFPADFYDSKLTLVLLRYLEPQKPCKNKDDLRVYISSLVSQTDSLLNEPEFQHYLSQNKNVT
ncbi:hypothetical protein GEMRC1_014160 [Eukaryota sp. GEM-RC1]